MLKTLSHYFPIPAVATPQQLLDEKIFMNSTFLFFRREKKKGVLNLMHCCLQLHLRVSISKNVPKRRKASTLVHHQPIVALHLPSYFPSSMCQCKPSPQIGTKQIKNCTQHVYPLQEPIPLPNIPSTCLTKIFQV